MASDPQKKTPSLSDLVNKKEDEMKESNSSKSEVSKSETNKTDKSKAETTNKPGNPDGVTFSGANNVINKTPAELSAETPDETAARYRIDTSISEEDAKNPRVQVYEDTHVKQVPSGTHLHPDIAKDLHNRGISEQGTDNAQVKRNVTEYYDFAPDAPHQDKLPKVDED